MNEEEYLQSIGRVEVYAGRANGAGEPACITIAQGRNGERVRATVTLEELHNLRYLIDRALAAKAKSA